MRIFKRLAAATAIVGLTGGAALAAPATVGADLNMRSGPGTNYAVVNTIPAGTTVDVMGCTGSWCEVSYRGQHGFASASYLTGAQQQGPVGYAPAPLYEETYYDDYDYGPSVGIGIYGPGYGYYGRDRWRHRWSDRGWRDRNWRGRDGDWRGGPGGPDRRGMTVQSPDFRGGTSGRVSGRMGDGGMRGGTISGGGRGFGGGTVSVGGGGRGGGGGAISGGGGGAVSGGGGGGGGTVSGGGGGGGGAAGGGGGGGGAAGGGGGGGGGSTVSGR